MINILKIVFGIMLVWICYNVVATCMQSNLFKQWHFLGSIPWMRATLWDFYTNIVVIYLWVCYKERGIFSKIIWLILLIALGSIASCAYVLIQLFKLKANQGLNELFINQNG